MEVELDNEQRRHAETQKGMRKQDRRLKELAFQADEDRKSQERMQDMIDKLQNKIKTYKRQVEEAVSLINSRMKYYINCEWCIIMILLAVHFTWTVLCH